MPKAAQLGKPLRGHPRWLQAGRPPLYGAAMSIVFDTDGLYWRDLPDWSEQQAAALRALSVRADLPNTLDLENLIEEVEDLGSAPVKATSSAIRRMLEHLIKLAAMPDAAARDHWIEELRNWFRDIETNFAPSMRRRIDMDDLWRKGRRDGLAALKQYGVPAPTLPEACPLPIDAFLGDEFDLDAALIAMAGGGRSESG